MVSLISPIGLRRNNFDTSLQPIERNCQRYPRQLLDTIKDVETNPIVLKPSGRVNRFVLDRECDLFYSVKVSSDFPLRDGVGIGVDGYVFNSSDHLWGADPLYRMTPERSRKFLKSSFLGILPGRNPSLEDDVYICIL
jgi:hypothetical protein